MTLRRAHCARALALTLAVLVFAPCIATAADAPQRTFVTLRVNTQTAGEALAVIAGDDVFLEPATLERLKVPIQAAVRRQFFGSEFVSLRSLGPNVTYKLDLDDLIVDLVLAPALFGTRVIDLGPTRPQDAPARRDRSIFFNYSLTEDQSSGLSGFAETGATLGAGRIYTNLTDTPANRFARGLSNLTFDAPGAMRTTVFGDSLATGGDLGGNSYLAGVQIGRQFGLNPYFVQFPTLNFSGSMAAPGRADVYVNGVLVRSVALQPGQFSLQGIAPPNGASNTQVVVTDSLGRSTVLGGAEYGAAALLRKGLTDYQYSIGFLRPNAFSIDDRYAGLGYMGRYRLGLTDNLSVGGRFEGSGNLLSGGPALDVGTRFGTLHLGGAVSRSGAARGAAADIGYGYAAPRFGFGGSLQYESDAYATTSLSAQQDRPISSASLYGSYQLSRQTSFSLDVSRANYRDSGTQHSASAYLTFAFGSVNFSLGASESGGTSASSLDGNGTSYFMTMSLGRGRTSSVLSSAVEDGKTIDSLQVAQSAPSGVGFGYRAAISNEPGAIFTGEARYNGPIGTYDLTTGFPGSGRPDSTFTLAGGIADVDGHVALARPLTDAFALVDVPGQSNVHVFVNGQDMGVTDRSGKLVVTNLVPNYLNHIRIDERETAFDTEITGSTAPLVPGIRSGALVSYAVKKVSAFTGNVVVRNGDADVIPAAGALRLTSETATASSDLGEDGAFYFENVAPGRYDGVVLYAGGRCAFVVNVPPASGLITTLGTLTCAQR